MNKAEAIEAIEAGKKITHRFFTDTEYVMKGKNGCYVFEDGYEFLPSVFWADRNSSGWDNGWSVFLERKYGGPT